MFIFFLKGKVPITISGGGKEQQALKITKEVRKWREEKIESKEQQKGKPSKEITGAEEYKLIKMWQEAILFKYKSWKEGTKDGFNDSVWTKWISRFPGNWDATNELFLQCVEGIQRGEVLYTATPDIPFVSI